MARRYRVWLLVDCRRRPMIKGTETGCTLARSAAGTAARSSQPVHWVWWCAAASHSQSLIHSTGTVPLGRLVGLTLLLTNASYY